jgi:hypothetical protein
VYALYCYADCVGSGSQSDHAAQEKGWQMKEAKTSGLTIRRWTSSTVKLGLILGLIDSLL